MEIEPLSPRDPARRDPRISWWRGVKLLLSRRWFEFNKEKIQTNPVITDKNWSVDNQRPSGDAAASKGLWSRIFPGLLAVGGIAGFAMVMWGVYENAFRTHTQLNDVPLIKADLSPTKVKPEHPGGLDVPHKDSMVLNYLLANKPGDQPVEKILSPAEEPVMPQGAHGEPDLTDGGSIDTAKTGQSPATHISQTSRISKNSVTNPDTTLSDQIAAKTGSNAYSSEDPENQSELFPNGAPPPPVDAATADDGKHTSGSMPDAQKTHAVPVPAVPVPAVPVPAVPVIDPKTLAPISVQENDSLQGDPSKQPKVAEKNTNPATKISEKQMDGANKTAAKKTDHPVSSNLTKPAGDLKSGQFAVQLMSSPNKAGVEKHIQELKKNHPDVIKKLGYQMKQAEIPGKGQYYRLTVGRFQTKAEATQWQNQLKAQNIDGFVVVVGP